MLSANEQKEAFDPCAILIMWLVLCALLRRGALYPAAAKMFSFILVWICQCCVLHR